MLASFVWLWKEGKQGKMGKFVDMKFEIWKKCLLRKSGDALHRLPREVVEWNTRKVFQIHAGVAHVDEGQWAWWGWADGWT